MPKNFPEAWLGRVRQKLSSASNAPWLNGIPELDTPLIVTDAGALSEKNAIHVPTTMFEVDVLINNTTYPIPEQQYTDDEVLLYLDKYQTKKTSLADDDTIGASYSKIDTVTASHVRNILKSKYSKAANALAPVSNTTATPIIETTGETLASGRKRMTYEDVVNLKAAMNLNDDEDNIRLVLCNDHWNDLLLDRDRFGNLLVDYQAGKPVPQIANFGLFKYFANPYFSAAGARLPFGSAPGATDSQGSFAFVTTNVALKTGMTRQYFKPSNIDTDNQSNSLNYRHYFLCLPVLAGQSGAIRSSLS